jgi:hypothetical protein
MTDCEYLRDAPCDGWFQCAHPRTHHTLDLVQLTGSCDGCAWKNNGEAPAAPQAITADQCAEYDRLRGKYHRGDVDLTCQHRGEKIREGVGDLCGRRGEPFDVFACELHGECVLTRFCRRQTEVCCLTCEDREP